MDFPPELIESVWSFARQMVADGIAHRAQGNLSARDAASGLIAVTPSAIPYDRLQVDDIVIVDAEGQVVQGDWKPTSELRLHLAFYHARVNVGAVVHSHAPYATLFGVIGEPLPMILTEAAACLGAPVPVAPYCRPGSQELADSAVRIADGSRAVILANHGLVTVGSDLPSAYDATLAAESTARTLWMARAMGVQVNLLDAKEVQAFSRAYQTGYRAQKPE